MRKILLFVLLLPAFFASGQIPDPQSGPALTIVPLPEAGGFRLRIKVPEGHYTYRSSPVAIPLQVVVKGLPAAAKTTVQLPQGQKKEEERILKGSFDIPVRISGAVGASRKLTVLVRYQLCIEKPPMCLAPQAATVVVNWTPPALPGRSGGRDNPPQKRAGTTAKPQDSDDDWVSGLIKKNLNNPLVAFLLAILGGFLASLTPCVYPVIPITVGYFSSRKGSRGGRLAAGLAYVAGMGLVYTLLGVIGGLAGSAFGSFTNSPLFHIGLGLLFVALSLSLFEVYEFRVPARLTAFQGSSSGHGGTFVMGMVTGLVASPCVGPLIVFLLTGVLQAGKPVLGAVLMAGFSIGMGILFLFLALFSQSGAKLPKSGNWMIRIKIALGMLVLGSSLYFLKQGLVTLGAPLWLMATLGLLIILGASTAGIIRLRKLYGSGSGHGRVLAVLALVLIGFFVLTYRAPVFLWNNLPEKLPLSVVERTIIPSASPDLKRDFLSVYAPQPGSGEYRQKAKPTPERVLVVRKLLVRIGVDLFTPALRRAAKTGRLLFIEVGARWCTTCHELEGEMAKSASLLALLRSRFVPYKADLDREGARLKKYLKLPGVPTLAVLRVRKKNDRLLVKTLWEKSSFSDLAAYIPWLEGHLLKLLQAHRK